MKYEHIEPGIFHSRPNRFIAKVETGRQGRNGACKEYRALQGTSGAGGRRYIWSAPGNPDRKTKWDLIAVEKGERMINMDSQAPNVLVKNGWKRAISSAILPGSGRNIPMEIPDLTCMWRRNGQKILMEVKGVTLEEDGRVRFPDAPSDRAVKLWKN